MVAHYYRELLSFCARSLKNREAAADLVQEAYARYLTAGRKGGLVRDPRTFLYRSARNLLADQYRRDAVRAHDRLDGLAEADWPTAADSDQPEQACAYNQYATGMVATIDALPPRCREAFILNRFEGLSHQEVADRMGISRNMVAQHVIRAVLACKACDARLTGQVRDPSGGQATDPPPTGRCSDE